MLLQLFKTYNLFFVGTDTIKMASASLCKLELKQNAGLVCGAIIISCMHACIYAYTPFSQKSAAGNSGAHFKQGNMVTASAPHASGGERENECCKCYTRGLPSC